MMTDSDRNWVAGAVVVGTVTVLSTSTWAGAALGAILTGGDVAAFSPLTIIRMMGGWSGWTSTWPGSPVASTITATLLDVIVVTGLVLAARYARRWFYHPLDMATLHQVRELAPKQAAHTAIRHRASLKDVPVKDVPSADRGVLLGDHAPSGVELRGNDEDTYLAIMAPRAGKSTSLAIPVAEEAPAALLMTSNKSDVYAATVRERALRGNVWALDTQGVARIERAMWWDMLAEAETLERTERLASHFIAQITSDSADPFWSQSANDLLVGLFRAAWHDGASIKDVLSWVANPAEKAPLRILYRHEPVLAEQVDASINIAEETQSGIFQNARTALSGLRDEKVLSWVTPDKHRPRFDPENFALSTDTLYLLSKKGGPASSVVAALADAVFTASSEAGERHGGRLPEPLRAVLDEAANICRIADLPDLFSHLGSRGINPYVILQSYRQGVKAWGEVGMDAMWSAATKKVIGAGVDDPKFVADIATLVGQRSVERGSYSKSKDGGSTSRSEQREQILEPSQIRAMPKGSALLLATGMPIAQIQLRPWYEEDSMQHIGLQKAAEERLITERALTAYEQLKAARRAR
ncbi:TraM recognition domain-containing protein [Streptomyces sp. OUCMDZ-4982]|uniref:type IV secretory system conjugative DNA transfer family protein n=1 Tax=Streptomyces sp. OUCMDZ-4982 TaxID=2973090 RepID=UPI00215D5369|nr:type IV secretory system conjugative DNA transfer family protein [Streptomyces sp. OUCMDZ-4982]MCR8945182.1 TraM recognition domain-containing protein [Streptomyces sp. OUCMDZ-4982]